MQAVQIKDEVFSLNGLRHVSMLSYEEKTNTAILSFEYEDGKAILSRRNSQEDCTKILAKICE